MGENEILAEPPLIGRVNQLETLQHHLDLAVQGKGTTVFISGEAGSGKTRLVTEFLTSSKQKTNLNELRGWCLSNSGVPYFPFIEAFKIYSSDTHTNDEEMGLKVWLIGPKKSEKTHEFENLSPQAWKDSTFAAVTQFLFSISAKQPTILFIDDLHWADTASLALLHYISRFIASERVLVLATFRSEDLNPDSEGRPHPLVDTLRLMGREKLFKEVKLQNLDYSNVSLLAENMVRGRVHSEFAQKLSEESQGNPLFIIESLKMLLENGHLIQEHDKWRLSKDEIFIPSMIKDILLRRVSILNSIQRKILDLASVIGSKFNPELLAAVATQDSLEILEILNNIEKSTALVVCEGDYYRFDHANYRDTLYEEISPLLRRGYHSRIADKLEFNWEDFGKENMPVGDLAFHYAQAGNKEKAVKYALAAGQLALKIYSGAEAIKHFRYVLDTILEDGKYSDEQIMALEGLGDGLWARGRLGDALKVFEQLSSSTNLDLVKSRALRKAIMVSFYHGDYANALDIVNRIKESPKVDGLENARVRFIKAAIKAYGGNFIGMLKEMEESIRVFEGEYSLSDMQEALFMITTPYVSADQLENALASGLRSKALFEYSKNAGDASALHAWLSLIYSLTKLEEEGLKNIEESLKKSEKISDPVSRALTQTNAHWLSGQLLEAQAAQGLLSRLPIESMRSFGRAAKLKFFMSSVISGALGEFKRGLKAAVAQSLKGVECAEETDAYIYHAFNYGNLVREYSALGELENAEKYYKKLENIFEKTTLFGVFHSRAIYSSSKASYFSARGQWREANQLYEEAMKVYEGGQIRGDMNMSVAGERMGYCWALLQQGRVEDAKLQYSHVKKTLDNLDKRFLHTNILGHLIAPLRVSLFTEFDMRLDLANVAKNSGILATIKNIIPNDFQVVNIQPNYNIQNDSIELSKKVIEPFTDEVITLSAKATKTGTFNLNPKLVYIDDLGETKTCHIDPVTINVNPPPK